MLQIVRTVSDAIVETDRIFSKSQNRIPTSEQVQFQLKLLDLAGHHHNPEGIEKCRNIYATVALSEGEFRELMEEARGLSS